MILEITFCLVGDCAKLSRVSLDANGGAGEVRVTVSGRFSGLGNKVSPSGDGRGEIASAGASGAVFAPLYMRPRPVISHSRLRAGK